MNKFSVEELSSVPASFCNYHRLRVRQTFALESFALQFSVGIHDFIEKTFHVGISRLGSLGRQRYQNGSSSSRGSLSETKDGTKVRLEKVHEKTKQGCIVRFHEVRNDKL